MAGAICGSAQIVTDIGVGSDGWFGLFILSRKKRSQFYSEVGDEEQIWEKQKAWGDPHHER